jgi:ubiquinone/menaquinone biosynthesis C-methylase UbiE
MKILEKQPEGYDEEFQKLFPESSEIYEMIKEKIGNKGRVLEIGCGTGQLAIQLAHQGLEVVAVDISSEMITYAEGNAKREGIEIQFIEGDFTSYQVFQKLEDLGPFDYIISTFVLSEFTPLRQKLFIKQTSRLLKSKGILFISADTYPSSFLKRATFSIKQTIKAQISIFRSTPSTNPVVDFNKLLHDYYSPELLIEKKQVKFFQCSPKKPDDAIKPRIKSLEPILGRFRRLKVVWCITNGIYTRKQVPPGLYQIGNPKKESPLLVTGNYYWTVHSVYQSILRQKIDCYLLIIDSNGINIWCAAGGKHFTHSQVIDALRLFDAHLVVDHKSLILPQLSATGVDHKEIKKFGWKAEFGPVYIENLLDYIETGEKTPDHGVIKFNLFIRTEMGIQHTYFITVSLFLPLLILTGLLGLFTNNYFWFFVSIQISSLALIISMIFAWIYPIFDFTRSFFTKSLILGVINAILTSIYLILGSTPNVETLLFWIALVLLVTMFIVLDFAGSTPVTNHLEVESDLMFFSIPALILVIVTIVLPLISPPITLLF